MRNWDDVTLWETTDKDLPSNDAVGRIKKVSFISFNTKESIPQEVKYLKYLESLTMYSNVNTMLLSIDLGSDVCNLDHLKYLEIGSYGLISLPDDFVRLGKSLEGLNLNGNNFTTIPYILTKENFPKLKSLSFVGNRRWATSDLRKANTFENGLGLHVDINLDMSIRNLFLWDTLEEFRLSYNYLEGSLPEFKVGELGVEAYTQADVDKFGGDTIQWLADNNMPKILPNMKMMSINLNYLTGSLPDWILYHPYLMEWFPDILVYNQMEYGVNSEGVVVRFDNVPKNNEFYYEAFPKYRNKYEYDDEYGATLAMEAKAIKYAADNGAVILQCSWGYNSALSNMLMYTPGPASEKEWEEMYPLEKEALDYFINNAGSPNGVIQGGLAIFAAGNEYSAMPAFPAAYSECVSVSSIAADYTPSSFTNYGAGVSLSAPGGDIDYYGVPGITQSDNEIQGSIFSTIVVNGQAGYGYMDGTSMACPTVAGVAALGLSYASELRRHFTADEFKSLLINTSRNIDQYYNGEKLYHYNHTVFGSPATKMDLKQYRGKMGGLVDAGALLRAVTDAGSDMKVPNIYITPNGETVVDLVRYFVGGETLTYSASVSDSSVATVEVAGGKMKVKGLSVGTTTASVKASNGKEYTITITVRNNAGDNGWM